MWDGTESTHALTSKYGSADMLQRAGRARLTRVEAERPELSCRSGARAVDGPLYRDMGVWSENRRSEEKCKRKRARRWLKSREGSRRAVVCRDCFGFG